MYNDAFSNELFIFVSNTIFAGQDYKENEPFSQDNLQADYTETLDGVLDFAYRDILLEEIRACSNNKESTSPPAVYSYYLLIHNNIQLFNHFKNIHIIFWF